MFWHGQILRGRVIGLALQTELSPDSNKLLLRGFAVSDGYTNHLVKGKNVKKFLITHADRRLVFFDGRQADLMLARLFHRYFGATRNDLCLLRGNLLHLPSLVAAALRPEQGRKTDLPQPGANYLSASNLEALVTTVKGILPADDPALARLINLHRETQLSGQPLHLQLATAAMAACLAGGPFLLALKNRAGAVDEAIMDMTEVFKRVQWVLTRRMESAVM